MEFLPFRILRLVHLHENVLADRVGAAAEDDHQAAHEDGRVLVAGERLLAAVLVRSLDPIPAAVSVPPQAPRVLQCALVVRSATEDDHRTSRAAHVAHGGRVVDADLRTVAGRIELLPGEWCLVDVQTPDIVDRLGAGVATEDEKVGLVEHDGVTVSPPGRVTDDWDDHPLRHRLTVAQVQ